MKTFIALIYCLTMCISSLAQSKNDLLFQNVENNKIADVRSILKSGGDVNHFVEAKSPYVKVNLLITAVNIKSVEMAQLLLDNKADINWKDGFNNRAIYYAARSGNLDMVKLLLKYGASVNDKDGNGNPVLISAKESQNKEVISFVEAKLKENTK